jgi:hypothetical protein
MPAIYSNDPNAGLRMNVPNASMFIPRSPTGTPSDVFSRMYTPAGTDPRNRARPSAPAPSYNDRSKNMENWSPKHKARWAMGEAGKAVESVPFVRNSLSKMFGKPYVGVNPNYVGPTSTQSPIDIQAPSAPQAPQAPRPLTAAQVADGIIPWSLRKP